MPFSRILMRLNYAAEIFYRPIKAKSLARAGTD